MKTAIVNGAGSRLWRNMLHSYAPFSTVMKPDNDLNYFLVASAGIRDLVDVEHAQYRLNYLSINFQHHFFFVLFFWKTNSR